MTLFTILAWAPPALIAVATLEGAVLSLWAGRAYDWRAYAASLADFLAREYVVNLLLPMSLATPLIALAARHPLTTVPLDGVGAFALLFLGEELCYYWFHRVSHRVRWFWASHAVHHSPNAINLGASYRFGWTGRLAGNSLFYVPMIWLGFPAPAVFATLSLNLIYQFWLHTDWMPKLGPLEYVLNTPSHHRVHHATNPAYLDRNYGGVLIVFDRLFGTLAVERDDDPCRFGLVKPLVSYNPARIAAHEWLNMAKDLRQARSLQQVTGCLFGPPGWKAGA